MEKEISCPSCGIKIDVSYSYCPHCAFALPVNCHLGITTLADDALFVQVKGRLSSLEERSMELQERLDSFLIVSKNSVK